MKIIALAAVSLLLGACTTAKLPEIAYDDMKPAVLDATPPPKAVQVVELPKLLPLPGQLKPLTEVSEKPEPANPKIRIARANKAARMEPKAADYLNAIQVYPFAEGALYQVYAAPSEITDIALEPGEQLVGTGPVAAGDTVRWIIGDTESGTGTTKRIHILVKPVRARLATNLVINTDRRTYHMELRSTEATYMASVSWTYPADQLIALRKANNAAATATPIVSGIDLNALRFRYLITGDTPPWRPVRVFDDGKQVFVEFPSGIGQGEMPPLWVLGSDGGAQLVNYRVKGRFMVVDQLFAAAELRLGGEKQQKVQILRSDGRGQ